MRTLPDVKVLTDFGAYGVLISPGSRYEVEVEVTPSSCGIICTLLMLDFGKQQLAWQGRLGGFRACSTIIMPAFYVSAVQLLL